MVGEDDLVERINSTFFYKRHDDSGRDEDIVESLSTSTVRTGFVCGAVVASMRVDQLAVCN